ncbi:MAG TPA: hypothetical protein VJB59_14865 [Bdellovibrionota bacterium]|nr:hypothetical protein [Bdellovibrionota bacterium]
MVQPKPNDGYYTISYEFDFRSGMTRRYSIRLDPDRISIAPSLDGFHPPAWTNLERCRCDVCPLTSEASPLCPAAANMAELVDHFKNDCSTDPVLVRVITPERTYLKETEVQYGLLSILGIILATSGCPVMNFLKPMARFHLPFSTHTETIVRSISIYLLRQYFRKRAGGEPDILLEELERKYAQIQRVNEGLLSRIRSVVSQGDADKNAILILHAFSQLLSNEISEKLESLEYLFKEE